MCMQDLNYLLAIILRLSLYKYATQMNGAGQFVALRKQVLNKLFFFSLHPLLIGYETNNYCEIISKSKSYP